MQIPKCRSGHKVRAIEAALACKYNTYLYVDVTSFASESNDAVVKRDFKIVSRVCTAQDRTQIAGQSRRFPCRM